MNHTTDPRPWQTYGIQYGTPGPQPYIRYELLYTANRLSAYALALEVLGPYLDRPDQPAVAVRLGPLGPHSCGGSSVINADHEIQGSARQVAAQLIRSRARYELASSKAAVAPVDDTRHRRLATALAAVRSERETHPARGYDSSHDLVHGVRHLTDLAQHYSSAYSSNSFAELTDSRKRLVKAASLLVAAVEVVDSIIAMEVHRHDPEQTAAATWHDDEDDGLTCHCGARMSIIPGRPQDLAIGIEQLMHCGGCGHFEPFELARR